MTEVGESQSDGQVGPGEPLYIWDTHEKANHAPPRR